MTERLSPQGGDTRRFLPLGSVVILRGSVKKLVIVSRGSIVEGAYFDYGAFLYPEGMIDTNVAYFNHGDILKVVHQGYADDDDELVVEILNDAYARFQQGKGSGDRAAGSAAAVAASPAVTSDDPFASVRDLVADDE